VEEVKNQEVKKMIGSSVEMELGDGLKYRLGQFTVTDLVYFEEKFGTADVLFNNKKPFTIILHVLYCILKKHKPELKFEDLDTLLPFSFVNAHPEIIEYVTQQLTGQKTDKAEKNPQ
jgi:hypothetical protein